MARRNRRRRAHAKHARNRRKDRRGAAKKKRTGRLHTHHGGMHTHHGGMHTHHGGMHAHHGRMRRRWWSLWWKGPSPHSHGIRHAGQMKGAANEPGQVYVPTYGAYQNTGIGPSQMRTFQKKSIVEAYLLHIVFGFLGAHHFYLNRPGWGILYFFTLGLCGVGYLMDFFRMPMLVENANVRIQDPTQQGKLRVDDAYVLWFPFGLLGFHHFYLRKPGIGLLYFFTFGLFGIGWLVDLFMIPKYVREGNEGGTDPGEKFVGTAYGFAISPLGILGGHHFYLNRYLFGFLYFFTFGLMGVGYIVDWFRVPFLVKRYNKNRKSPDMPTSRYIDDAYVLWFPLGMLGLHHFYLNRPGWGFLYLFTFGLCGIGWLIDGFRIPGLVRDYNLMAEERRRIPVIRGPITQVIAGSGTQGPYVQTTVGAASVTLTLDDAKPSGGVVPPPYIASGGYQGNQTYPQQQGYPPQQQGYPVQQGYPQQGYPQQTYPLQQGYATSMGPAEPPPSYTALDNAGPLPKKD